MITLFYHSTKHEKAKEIQTSLIALTQRYRPPALERICVGADGLLNVIAKNVQNTCFKNKLDYKSRTSKEYSLQDDRGLYFLIGAFLNN